MDSEYYDRKAEGELKKVAAEMKKRGDYEAQAARKEEDALKDDAAASSTSSDSTRRSKLRSAESHRKKALDLRKKAAAAGLAASKAQTAANKLRPTPAPNGGDGPRRMPMLPSATRLSRSATQTGHDA